MNAVYAWVGDVGDEEWLLVHDLDEFPRDEFKQFQNITYFGVAQSATFDEAVAELVHLSGVSPDRTAASHRAGLRSGLVPG